MKFFGDWNDLSKTTAVVGIMDVCVSAVDLTEVTLEQSDITLLWDVKILPKNTNVEWYESYTSRSSAVRWLALSAATAPEKARF